jgi:hypothetical protein
MENRPEPRVTTDILVRVWGMDADGKPFFQNVRAHNISSKGALLSALEHKLNPGDIVGVQLRDYKARCRVVWVIDGGPLQKVQVGVQLLEGQGCPWKDELAKAAKPPAADGENKRRFARHQIKFPIELRDRRDSPMQTNATDISGRGCYVETLLPLPFGTGVKIAFWIESEKVSTEGVIRASDPGVGMGIEFSGLDYEAQERFQKLLESMDASGAPKADSQSAG